MSWKISQSYLVSRRAVTLLPVATNWSSYRAAFGNNAANQSIGGKITRGRQRLVDVTNSLSKVLISLLLPLHFSQSSVRSNQKQASILKSIKKGLVCATSNKRPACWPVRDLSTSVAMMMAKSGVDNINAAMKSMTKWKWASSRQPLAAFYRRWWSALGFCASLPPDVPRLYLARKRMGREARHQR